jgi:hypothetical protein
MAGIGCIGSENDITGVDLLQDKFGGIPTVDPVLRVLKLVQVDVKIVKEEKASASDDDCREEWLSQ